jgi:hypothetical protein
MQAEGGDTGGDRRGGEIASEGQQHHRDQVHHRGRRDVEAQAPADTGQRYHGGAAEHRLRGQRPEFASLILRHLAPTVGVPVRHYGSGLPF